MAKPTQERAAAIRSLVARMNEAGRLQATFAAALFDVLAEDDAGRIRFGCGPGHGPGDFFWNRHECWRSPDTIRINRPRALSPFGVTVLEADSPSLREYPATLETTNDE